MHLYYFCFGFPKHLLLQIQIKLPIFGLSLSQWIWIEHSLRTKVRNTSKMYILNLEVLWFAPNCDFVGPNLNEVAPPVLFFIPIGFGLRFSPERSQELESHFSKLAFYIHCFWIGFPTCLLAQIQNKMPICGLRLSNCIWIEGFSKKKSQE